MVNSCAPTTEGLNSRIELAELRASATYGDVHLACLRADRYGLRAVAVQPVHCRRAAKLLRGTPVRLVAVVAFPSGAFTIPGKTFEARDVIAQGASEISFVVNMGALLAGNELRVSQEMKALRRATDSHTLRATVDATVLRDGSRRSICRLAVEHGIDLLETSTGIALNHPSVDDIRSFCHRAAGRIRITAVDRIESAEKAEELIAAGASRLRTSFSPFMAGSEHEPT